MALLCFFFSASHSVHKITDFWLAKIIFFIIYYYLECLNGQSVIFQDTEFFETWLIIGRFFKCNSIEKKNKNSWFSHLHVVSNMQRKQFILFQVSLCHHSYHDAYILKNAGKPTFWVHIGFHCMDKKIKIQWTSMGTKTVLFY